jgi:hypothetical protein
MTASYERLLEEFYMTDRSKLEHLIQSNAIEILNDDNMRNLLRGFIERLDKDSNFETNAMKAVKYFEILITINTVDDLLRERDEVENYCSRLSDLTNVLNDSSSLNQFVNDQKHKSYREVDDSDEFSRFKDYLRHKYQSSNRRRRRHHHHHR